MADQIGQVEAPIAPISQPYLNPISPQYLARISPVSRPHLARISQGGGAHRRRHRPREPAAVRGRAAHRRDLGRYGEM